MTQQQPQCPDELTLFDFMMKLAETQNDLNGVLMLMELSRQRDTFEKFQTKIFPKVQHILKRLGQELTDLSVQEIAKDK